MLEKKNVLATLGVFGKDVVTSAKLNFAKKNASGEGSNSLKFTSSIDAKSSEISFWMEDYMEFQDKGVSGKKRKFNTPFSYKDKKPPIIAFNGWSIRRGLAPRDERGRFLPRKAVLFALSNHIFNQGIKPTRFFSNAIDLHQPKLIPMLEEAYRKDIENEAKKINK